MRQEIRSFGSLATLNQWPPIAWAAGTPLCCRLINVSPMMAAAKLESARYERQRPLRPSNIERMIRDIEAGTFEAQAYLCVLPDGREKLVNGTHTLYAIQQTGVTWPITVTYRKVESIEEIDRTYVMLDTQARRTWGDSLRAVGKSDEIPNAKWVGPAVGFIQTRFGAELKRGFVDRLKLIDDMFEYKEAAELFAIAANAGVYDATRVCKTEGVLAIALTTLRYQPVLAAEFWDRVMHDDGLKKGMPERALLQWLRNNRMAGKFAHDVRYLRSRAAALAWNARVRGDKVDFLKVQSFTRFHILATPFESWREQADNA